jgi:hypothetical protein
MIAGRESHKRSSLNFNVETRAVENVLLNEPTETGRNAVPKV